MLVDIEMVRSLEARCWFDDLHATRVSHCADRIPLVAIFRRGEQRPVSWRIHCLRIRQNRRNVSSIVQCIIPGGLEARKRMASSRLLVHELYPDWVQAMSRCRRTWTSWRPSAASMPVPRRNIPRRVNSSRLVHSAGNEERTIKATKLASSDADGKCFVATASQLISPFPHAVLSKICRADRRLTFHSMHVCGQRSEHDLAIVVVVRHQLGRLSAIR